MIKAPTSLAIENMESKGALDAIAAEFNVLHVAVTETSALDLLL